MEVRKPGRVMAEATRIMGLLPGAMAINFISTGIIYISHFSGLTILIFDGLITQS